VVHGSSQFPTEGEGPSQVSVLHAIARQMHDLSGVDIRPRTERSRQVEEGDGLADPPRSSEEN
jgi:hypothetical protein